jgi:hypothetical protein
MGASVNFQELQGNVYKLVEQSTNGEHYLLRPESIIVYCTTAVQCKYFTGYFVHSTGASGRFLDDCSFKDKQNNFTLICQVF